MFSSFALSHAWLIPLLPGIAFVLAGFLRALPRLAAAIAVAAIAASFALSGGVIAEVLSTPITVEAHRTFCSSTSSGRASGFARTF